MAHVRRPTRPELELALKAAVSAGLAMAVSEGIGLADPYWAGISAVVAAGATLGASLLAALQRIAATLVGLAIGFVAFAIAGGGTLVGVVTVLVALAILPALSLAAGARLGAATTLIVVAVPGSQAVQDAVARGINVPLGCAVAVLVALVLLPRRAGERLRAALRRDVAAAGALAERALGAYATGRREDELAAGLAEVRRAQASHPAALREALREPGGHGERGRSLGSDVAVAAELADHAGALVAVAGEGERDRAGALVGGQLEAVGEAVAAATAAYGSPEFPTTVSTARTAAAALDAAFAAVRAHRGTGAYPTAEVVRLTVTLRTAAGLVDALGRLDGDVVARM